MTENSSPLSSQNSNPIKKLVVSELAVIESLTNPDKRNEEAIVFQNRAKNVKKVFAQILPTDLRLTKGDTFEEIFLSFHARILKNFFLDISENNYCFFDCLFLKSVLANSSQS